jgi:hypothetical protein
MSNWKFNKDGWTNWITHDGKGCPCVGWMVQARWKSSDGTLRATASDGMETFIAEGGKSWYWGKIGYAPIILYRVRKPKGLTMLEELLEKLPETV